jgi:hypothetical protein
MSAPAPGRFGRMPPPPPGKIWVRNPQVGWGLSIVEAVQRFTDAGLAVPEHLVELAGLLPADLPESSVELVDSDFVELPPYASAEPMTAAPAAEPDVQPSLWDTETEAGVDLEGWTVAELKSALDDLEVDYPADARKTELIALLQEAEM